MKQNYFVTVCLSTFKNELFFNLNRKFRIVFINYHSVDGSQSPDIFSWCTK